MTLPDRRPATLGQPAYQPQPISGTVQPYAPMQVERVPIKYVPDPYNPGMSVAVDARLLQPAATYHPRDLTPQPVLDPAAQRMLGAGLGGGALAAGAGNGTQVGSDSKPAVRYEVGRGYRRPHNHHLSRVGQCVGTMDRSATAAVVFIMRATMNFVPEGWYRLGAG